MNKILKGFVILLHLLSAASVLSANKIILAADYWCPYNCSPSNEKEGFLLEIARQAFVKKEMVVEYKIAPWTECLEMLAKGEVDGLLGVAEGETENLILPSVEQASSMVSAFTLSDNTWVYDGPSSFAGRVLGVTEGYRYSSDIRAFIYSNYISRPYNFIFSSETNSVADNINKLLNHEIFMFIEDENVISYYIKENNLSGIRNAGNVIQKPTKLYIAFNNSNKNAEEYARLISETTIQMRSTGKLRRLYKKYNMKYD